MKATNGQTGKANGSENKTEKELSAIEKIRKLMEFSVENGATEAEVENAIKAAQRLMMKHNLEQKDIEVTSKDVNVTVVKSTWKDGMEARSFENALLTTLGQTFSCMIVINRNKATNTDTYDVIGLPEDREMLVATYESVLPQIRSITKTRFKESEKDMSLFKFTTSYQSGFLVGLREKLTADRVTFLKVSERKEFELMVVNKDALVKEWVGAHMSIKTGKSKPIGLDKDAFEQGVKDGSEKGLNKQLGK